MSTKKCPWKSFFQLMPYPKKPLKAHKQLQTRIVKWTSMCKKYYTTIEYTQANPYQNKQALHEPTNLLPVGKCGVYICNGLKQDTLEFFWVKLGFSQSIQRLTPTVQPDLMLYNTCKYLHVCACACASQIIYLLNLKIQLYCIYLSQTPTQPSISQGTVSSDCIGLFKGNLSQLVFGKPLLLSIWLQHLIFFFLPPV